ncbi:hypothetical protein GCM10027610_067650 [Dactylosporangium cerinum]
MELVPQVIDAPSGMIRTGVAAVATAGNSTAPTVVAAATTTVMTRVYERTRAPCSGWLADRTGELRTAKGINASVSTMSSRHPS